MFKYIYKNRGVSILVFLICFGFIFLNISQARATPGDGVEGDGVEGDGCQICTTVCTEDGCDECAQACAAALEACADACDASMDSCVSACDYVDEATQLNCIHGCNSSSCYASCSRNNNCSCPSCGSCTTTCIDCPSDPANPCIADPTLPECSTDPCVLNPSLPECTTPSTHRCTWTACVSGVCKGKSGTFPIDDDCPESDCDACSGGGSTGKCGYERNNTTAKVCKFDGTGAGSCQTDADCNPGGCTIANQFNPHSVCSSSTCTSVSGCGFNECDSTTPCSCSIESFDITPVSRLILLGNTFKTTWESTNCDYCNLSCSVTSSGGTASNCGSLPANYLASNSSSLPSQYYPIKPTKTGSYSYTLECFNSNTSSKLILGAGANDDKPFTVKNLFWRETPAFLKVLFDKIYSLIQKNPSQGSF